MESGILYPESGEPRRRVEAPPLWIHSMVILLVAAVAPVGLVLMTDCPSCDGEGELMFVSVSGRSVGSLPCEECENGRIRLVKVWSRKLRR